MVCGGTSAHVASRRPRRSAVCGVVEVRSGRYVRGSRNLQLLRQWDLGSGRYRTWGNDYLVDARSFDPDAPGEPGAVCLATFGGNNGEGHIAIYVDEHTLIQSLTTTGVTDQFTDIQTHVWPECGFEIYGHIPGVDYSGGKEDGNGSNEAAAPPRWLSIDRDGWLRADGEDWSRGWYDRQWNWHRADDPG